MKAFDKDKFHAQLQALNILEGDTVFINCDLSSFGVYQGFKRTDYVNIFLDYLGASGTVVTFAYTGLGWSFASESKIPYFDGTQKANTGAFSNIMLQHPLAKRSSHPSSSIVAIGKHAEKITQLHTAESGAYSFIQTLMDLNAKTVLIGVRDYPGFVTHKVEEDLKLYKQYWDRFFYSVRLPGGKVFKRRDPGGCSKIFDRLYPYYIKEEKLRIGYIGGAYSLAMVSKEAYEIDYKVIKKNPKILICDDPNCFRCRVSRWKTIWRLPLYLTKKIFAKLNR